MALSMLQMGHYIIDGIKLTILNGDGLSVWILYIIFILLLLLLLI